jgi:hypothetical protein
MATYFSTHGPTGPGGIVANDVTFPMQSIVFCCVARRSGLMHYGVLRKELTRMPRTARGRLDERNPNTDAERGQIQYDHDKSKQIESHHQSDCGVHCQNANQPKESGLLDPNENWVTDLDQAD